MTAQNVYVTGASGYLGSQLIDRLVKEVQSGRLKKIIATDVAPLKKKYPEVIFIQRDIRASGLAAVFKQYEVDSVIHLASVVTPRKDQGADFCYQVDVLGTQYVLEACVQTGVEHLVVSSSGAAYGYHADNPAWLKETDAVRGNREFAYSYHKGLVEEMLAKYRLQHPNLKQTIFRVGTILGSHTRNQITDLFEKPRLIGVSGSQSPFVFIWDQDLVEIFTQALFKNKPGIYNVAGDGALGVEDIARTLDKKVLWIPPKVLGFVLKVLYRFGLSQYDSQQVRFLQYRPVLDNERLKKEFGYVPQKNSKETLEFWRDQNINRVIK